MAGDIDQRRRYSATTLVLALFFFSVLLALHIPLLHLPYFWDEAGYYVPAARDLLLHGTLIPHSTLSNAHPPLVIAYLALAWKVLGYAPWVARTAMLAVAAFSLLGIFRLAQRVANTEVAVGAAICTALYPVFFAQSSLAHLDLAAAGLTFWGLLAYVEDRRSTAALWFCMAVLAKETAVLAPLALLVWDLIKRLHARIGPASASQVPVVIPDVPVVTPKVASVIPITPVVIPSEARDLGSSRVRGKPRFLIAFAPRNDIGGGRSFSSLLLIPLIPLALWYAFHYARTGFVFGNPEFFRYNVKSTMQPLRVLLALGLRLWQVVGYLNFYVLTLSAVLAMWLPPLSDNGEERRRISPDVQFSFLAVIVAYVLAMSVVGGAVLARYMLPVVPLVIILFVSTLRRRVRLWRSVIAIVALAFVAALFVNPPYGFSVEDNLAYRDYILLHQHAETFVEARYPMSRVLTAWPASDELARPYLGYVTRPMRVFRIEDFTVEQLMAARDQHSNFDVAVVFSTKYEPPHSWFDHWRRWQLWKTQFFGYHRDVPPAAAAQILGGRLVYDNFRDGQWVGVIELEPAELAQTQNTASQGRIAMSTKER
ncbi:MAG TPA: glycosyltransferase family 39 protein [Terriglobales bacterium]|nr:glycosyltransferase family 39 protein [Terriglobales bacterium]